MDNTPGSEAGSVVAVALSDAVVIPRTALYDGNKVFLVEPRRLAQRHVEVGRFQDDEAVFSSDLRVGGELVLPVASAPVIGMGLRTVGVEPPSTGAAGALTESPPAGRREQ